MSDERACIRGCGIPGTHYAHCPDYGNPDGECRGCAPRLARDGALICSRCYWSLRSKLEQAPDLIEQLREMTLSVSAKRYDRVGGQATPAGHAPVSPDVLDAIRDITETVAAAPTDAYSTPAEMREATAQGVAGILARFDELVNNADLIGQWWVVVAMHEIPHHPEFWTIGRALSRWPVEDRSRWASFPCPDCDLKTVRITPPYRSEAPTRYTCQQCDWSATDTDDAGFWATIDPYEKATS